MTADPLEPAVAAATSYPLLDSLIHRRSRRFAPGMTLNGGPLEFTSSLAPEPLTQEEEAMLVFAACGVTGFALGELPYASGAVPEAGSGTVMSQFRARTAISGDAIHADAVFVINDSGTWFVRRPQDFESSALAEQVQAAMSGDVLGFYEAARVQISDHRADVAREIPYVPAFNKWSANQPGTTYFVPVHELSAFYINVALTAFDEEFGYFVVDDTARFAPAGIGKFAKSKGGHLFDDAKAGRTIPLGVLDTWIHEFAAIEQGAILQNLGLMTQALGLGGFAHFAHHPWAWLDALGFDSYQDKFSKSVGSGKLMTLMIRLLGRDFDVPVHTGLKHEGQLLLKPYSPPHYPDMEAAVLAYVDHKYGSSGTPAYPDGASAWKDGGVIAAGVKRPSEQTIATAVAFCSYVFRRFGRFPATNGPFRTVLAYQASHLDPAFYERFYADGALSETQRNHRH